MKNKMVFVIVRTITVVKLIFFGLQYQKYEYLDEFAKKPSETSPNSSQESEFDNFLRTHPVFGTYSVSRINKRKKRVNVLVIVSSAPKRRDRRDSIRRTWWKQCVPTKKIIPECIMTDLQKPNSTYHNAIQAEQKEYGDLKFQDLKGGIQFGVRYINHVLFAFLNYNFDYLLRMDDDYFFCMNGFLSELPVPMEAMFHWGWTHCLQDIVRPEESMLLFSRDLLMRFLGQDPQKIKCHPWADQMIGAWAEDLNITKSFRHDPRLHHVPVVSKEPSLRTKKNLCQKYMGIHGCYAKDMLLLWENRGTNLTSKGTLKTNSLLCIDDSGFKWDKFSWIWKYKPEPCISNPAWNTSKQTLSGGAYTGRGESGG